MVMAMLILSRKVGQAIIIMNDIKITILGLDRDRVKIGIDAPKDIVILRDELLMRGSAIV